MPSQMPGTGSGRSNGTGRGDLIPAGNCNGTHEVQEAIPRALDPQGAESSVIPAEYLPDGRSPPLATPSVVASPVAGREPITDNLPSRIPPPPSSERQPESPGPHSDWRDHLLEAVTALEKQVGEAQEPEDVEALAAKLRLLKLAAGLRDDALETPRGRSDPLADYWAKQVFALWLLTDARMVSNREARLREAAERLDEAVSALREQCPLIVRNLAFVTDVQSYGVFTPFERYEFVPGQRLLLYAEVENLQSLPTPKGYHSKSRAHIEITEYQGKCVGERSFAPTEEYCRNRRRDFFLGFEFDLPSDLTPGRYYLELKITDLHSGKVGRSTVEFTVILPKSSQ
ncbi:MAG: hypothetical protein NZ899_03525 [Thermoguttaceae bacterium]|nr:hypothetical protein [Thermoguttaceae bacterium]MDW8078813.1 hypothetical protein [Thermoguttaceae bacterium]